MPHPWGEIGEIEGRYTLLIKLEYHLGKAYSDWVSSNSRFFA